MNSNTVFERLGTSHHDFSGNYQTPALPLADSTFTATLDITRDAAAVQMQGHIVMPAGAPVPFRFTLAFATAETPAPSAALSCDLVGDVSGPLLISPDGFEFIGTTPTATITLNLRFAEHEALLVKGMVLRRDGSVAFSASPVLAPDGRAKPKVFAIRLVQD